MFEIRECVYFNSVLGVCDIDGNVNCPCENYEELIRMSEITKEKRRDMITEKRFERIYADVDVFCKDHNAKGVSQLIGREDYDKIVDLLNEQHELIERLKWNFRALYEVKCELAEENEQLKQHNAELVNKIDFLERVIDGDV